MDPSHFVPEPGLVQLLIVTINIANTALAALLSMSGAGLHSGALFENAETSLQHCMILLCLGAPAILHPQTTVCQHCVNNHNTVLRKLPARWCTT